ncbi:F-box protein At2g17690-like [Eutrema salsugineum]|uniref:F-box protein At2g17690-like n=1 Tax=Eutrema salsugineum TaxID=72664 RepID=UPI000CED509B|nr:F-box protein At2g17690-like [Eutrema salsugineum]
MDLRLKNDKREIIYGDRLLEEKPRERFNLDGHVPPVGCFAYVLHDNVENVICHPSDLESPDLNSPITVGFKVYGIHEELGKWVEVNSVGDNAFLVATDYGFSVLANEFYGCLGNSIYFTNKECEIQVFKLVMVVSQE